MFEYNIQISLKTAIMEAPVVVATVTSGHDATMLMNSLLSCFRALDVNVEVTSDYRLAEEQVAGAKNYPCMRIILTNPAYLSSSTEDEDTMETPDDL